MTERELSSLMLIRARIKKLEARIAEMEAEDGLGSVNMDGMPHGTTPGNPVERMALARAALHEELLSELATLKERELAIQKYIDSVDDEYVKFVMELRFIQLMDWYNIACEVEEVTGKDIDRSTPAKKIRRYLAEKGENSHISH